MAVSDDVSKTIAFDAFLIAVSIITSGLTFLVTIANFCSAVLVAPRYMATRIILAR
jgi:hypothetical protein